MKILLTIILTTITILFAAQNFDHVNIYIFAGKPVPVRLFFVMASCGVIGYLTRFMIGISKEDEIKKRYRMLRLQDKKKQYGAGHDDHDDI
nr:hypothetical protein [Desulfobulbaceae bacterium]